MEEKKCPSCGAPLAEGATVCLRCLEPLSEKTAVETERPPLGMKRAIVFASALFAAAIVVLAVMFSARAKNDDAPESATVSDTVSIVGVERNTETVTESVTESDSFVQTESDAAISVETSSEDAPAPYVAPDTEETAHVHTASCYKKVIDVPYRPAEYYTEDEYETVGDANAYAVYRVDLCDFDDPSVVKDSLTFPNESEYLKWKNKNSMNSGTVDGIDYVVYNGDMYAYKVYVDSSSETVVVHRKGDLKTPEQQEVSHEELICGYE